MALGIVLVLTASVAHASEGGGSEGEGSLFGSVHPELAGRFMVNTTPPTPSTQAPPLVGGGPGVRAGVSVWDIYAGLSYVDFLSASSCLDSYPGPCGSTHAASYGLELGYGHTFFRMLLVRALLGVGDRVVTGDGTTWTCSGTPTCSMLVPTRSHASRGDLYWAPSVLVAALVGPVLVGADVTLLYMPEAGSPGGPSAPFVSVYSGAQLGLRL